MGQSLRMMVVVGFLGVLGVSGCGPCRCADGSRFARDISCEECFHGCAKLGSIATSCRFEELNAAEPLSPIPDPTFAPKE